jgi:hypothetical protein
MSWVKHSLEWRFAETPYNFGAASVSIRPKFVAIFVSITKTSPCESFSAERRVAKSVMQENPATSIPSVRV